MSDSSSEDIPRSAHPRIGKPRVSFSGASGALAVVNGLNSGESRRHNNGYTIDEDPDAVQSYPVCQDNGDKSGRAEGEVLEMADLGNVEVPVNKLNRRRVSVTAAGDAVVVRGADKSYVSGQPVLNGLNMTVPCGSIYGLLGSSGCGKTTLLSCIVGQRKLDKGNIWIFGEKPGTQSIGVPGRNIGYMPQDISLYVEFSIGETLNYFGTLSGMGKAQITSAKTFLVKLLDLPEQSRRVATLSGGQQRRVSFAAALIHDPELLVLDEPTVGVDPLLRQKIWLHLQKLVCSKRTTVVITTHYIEECRQADNIGIMRSGRLLTERQPTELFAEHHSTNLETIVLHLSRRDTVAKLEPAVLAKAVKNSAQKKARRKAEKDGKDPTNDEISTKELDFRMASVMHEPEPALMDSLVRIRALAGKNFVILLRNPLLLFFVLFVAAAMLVLICISLGPDPIRMRMGLVNHEVNYLSICANVTRAPGECDVENLSCHFLRNIPQDTLHLKIFETEDEAIAATHKGNVWGYIAFPVDFSTNLYERIASGANVDELTLNTSQINVRLDESNKQISAAIKRTLYDAYEDFTKAFLLDCGFDSRQADSPLMYRKPIFGRDDTDFREFLAPGVTPSLLFFYPIITTSIRYIKEKRNGVLDRSLVAGVKTWEIMVAYSISEFFVLLTQSILNYCVLTVLFQIDILGSDILVIIIFLLGGYGGVSMGFLLGSVCTEEIQAAMLAMAAFFPNFILSGLVWPVEGMEVWLQYIVQVLPCTLSGESVRSVTSRGWEFTHPNVWPGFVILIAYIVGYFILTILFHVIFKR